jgi:glycosyltransferase involved in cell wall biosynthesis
MHILLIHQIFVTPDEGGGTRHYEFAKLLAEKGHKLTVVASRVNYLSGIEKNKGMESIDGINIMYASSFGGVHQIFFHRVLNFLSFSLTAFFKAMQVKYVDLVWGTSPPLFQAVTALVIARTKGASFVLEIRDLWVDFSVQLGVIKNIFIVKVLKNLEKFLYKNSKSIIVNSPGFISAVSQYTDRNNIYLVPNSVITHDFEIGPEAGLKFRKDHRLENCFIAMYVGNIGVANDIDMILNTAEKLKHLSDVKFVLIGNGIKKEYYLSQAKKRGLGNFTMIDTMPKRLIPYALSAADVCVATLKDIGLFKTVFPNKVFDYMAAARPVVLAVDGAIRKVVEDAGAGIFSPPGDSSKLAETIMKYYNNAGLKKTHGTAGREYVKANFERSVIADKLEVILNSAIGL